MADVEKMVYDRALRDGFWHSDACEIVRMVVKENETYTDACSVQWDVIQEREQFMEAFYS